MKAARRSLALLGLAASLGAAPASAVWEGFEHGGTRWSSGEEGGLIKAAISRDVASEGRYSFGGRVEVASLEGDPKAGFWLLPDADFTGVEGMRFDLFNGTRAEWDVTLIIQSGNDWGWNEARLGTLKPGWNRDLGVDFRDGFGGKPIMSLNPIPKVSILLRPKAPTQGALYLDHVRLLGPGAAALAPALVPGAREMLLDSFEGPSSAFQPIYGIGVRVEPDPDRYTHGRQGLRLVAVSKDPEAEASFGYEAEVDLSRVQSVVLDVHNPGPPAKLAFATAIGEQWDYAASPSVDLRSGWNRGVSFNFHARDFKSAASNWRNNGPLPSLKVRRFAFVWHPGDTGRLSLTIDNLRLRAADDAALKALAPSPPLRGWEQPLWDGSGGSPAFAGPEHPRARAAGLSQAYTLPGAGPSLRLDWLASERGQSADFEWSIPVDLRGVRALRVDAYNPGSEAVDLALAVQAGAAQDWMESRPLRLAPGWNHGLELPLEGPVFKHAATQWAYGASLPGRGPEALRRGYWHVLSPGPGPGRLYLARVAALRRSAVPGTDLPVAVEGSLKAGLALEPVTWAPWDSGAGEGTFEKGLSGWKGLVAGPADGGSSVGLGSEGASQGSRALRADLRGNGQDKAGVVYEPGPGAPALPDLGRASRLRFDIYNPGPPMGFGVAFSVGPSGTWVESVPLPLRSGWNRDLTLDLEAPVWRFAAGSSVPGATQIHQALPKELRGPGMLTKLTLLFHKARHGVVWVDNIRIGGPGSSIQHQAEAELALRLFAGPLSVKLAGRTGEGADGSAWVLPAGSHLGLRGLGQELVLSAGEAAPAFDDVLGVYTAGRQMDNGLDGYSRAAFDQVSALRWKGNLAGLQAQGFGALPWGPAPFSFGGSAFGGLRLKAPGPAGSHVGGAWLHQRLGYEPGADLFTGAAEQSSQILVLDGRAALPGGLSLGAAYGRTEWGAAPERRLLRDADGLPHLWQRPIPAERDAVKAVLGWGGGPLELAASYADVGGGFDATLSDSLYNARRDEARLTFRPGALGWGPPADALGWAPGLRRGLALTLQTYSHASADRTYAGRTLELRLENDRDQPLGYMLNGARRQEDRAPAGAAALEPSARVQWGKALLRGRPWDGASWQLGGMWRSYDFIASRAHDAVYGLEWGQRLWRRHRLSGALAQVGRLEGPGLPGGADVALHGQWRAQWLESLSSSLSYGRPPLGEELNVAWPVTDPTVRLSVEANF